MKILVIGLGSMGRRRLRNLTYLGGHDLAGMEPSADRAGEVGAEFGIPTFASLGDAWSWKPEAVVISTPPDTHTAIALEAARRGVHFFTEASVVHEGMDELTAAVADAGVVAAPSCTMRFHPAVGRLQDRLSSGDLGRPLVLTHHVGQYLPDWHPWEDYRTYYVAKRETGAAREIVPFELNWLTYLFGPVTAVTALRGKVSDLDVDIDDTYSAAMAFANGVEGTMVIEVVSRPAIRRARIACEAGTLIWDWNDRMVREWRADSEVWEEFPDPAPVEGPGGEWVAENMYIEEMRGYIDAVAGREPWPLTIDADVSLLQTVLAMERSSDALRGS